MGIVIDQVHREKDIKIKDILVQVYENVHITKCTYVC